MNNEYISVRDNLTPKPPSHRRSLPHVITLHLTGSDQDYRLLCKSISHFIFGLTDLTPPISEAGVAGCLVAWCVACEPTILAR